MGKLYLSNFNSPKIMETNAIANNKKSHEPQCHLKMSRVVNRKSVNQSSVLKPMIGYHCL